MHEKDILIILNKADFRARTITRYKRQSNN